MIKEEKNVRKEHCLLYFKHQLNLINEDNCQLKNNLFQAFIAHGTYTTRMWDRFYIHHRNYYFISMVKPQRNIIYYILNMNEII